MSKRKSRVCGVIVRGPLAPFAELYRGAAGVRGYTPLSVVNLLRQVARFSCWLEANGLSVGDVNGERITAFLVFQRDSGLGCGVASRHGLRCLQDVLRGEGVVGAVVSERPLSQRKPVALQF